MTEKEKLCRMTLEPHGIEVLEFWLDEDDCGNAKVKMPDGKERIFTQNPKNGVAGGTIH